MKATGPIRHLLASVLAFTLLAAAPAAFAETHALIPGATVQAGTPVAVDSVWHFIFTLDANNQVQVTWFGNNKWNTVVLGATGRPVAAGGGAHQLLYVDTGYHILYYIGDDNHLWCWYWSGSAWTNKQLVSSQAATDLVGVDSSFHYVWYRFFGQLWVAYYNGSAWVTVQGPITDYDGLKGAAVDQTTHSLYWYDHAGYGATVNSLRALYWTGRAYQPVTLNSDSDSVSCRPAVHQGTGEVFGTRTFRTIYKHYANVTLGISQTAVGSASDGDLGKADLAVNPTNGKVICTGANPSLISVLTPSGTGGSTTWTRANVVGTDGTDVTYSAMDNSNGWYLFTDFNNIFLHIIY